MRILMLTSEFPPGSAGGIAAHVDGLSRAIAAAGHEIVVITRRHRERPDDEVLADGRRVLRVDTELPWLPDLPLGGTASANHAFVAAAHRLTNWRPEIVHAHDWTVAWAADVLGTWYQAPIVTTFHGTERGRHGGHLPPGIPTDINSVEWWQALRSTQVITATRLLVREIVDGFEVDPNHVRRIPGGIDPTWWREGSSEHDAERAASMRVFAWGRVRYEKGFQVLARAVGSLRGRLPGIECMIAGRGSYLPELQSQIDIAGVGDLIELPGFLSGEQLRTSLQRAGCVVIPSLYEPFGVVALEALAARAPLIVAETGGLAETVGGSGSALLFEPGNADELATCIERLLTDRELAADLVRSAQELLQATYTWDAIALRTLAVYDDARA